MKEGGATKSVRLTFGPILAATVFTIVAFWLWLRVADVFLLLFLGVLISLFLGALAGVLHRKARVPQGFSLLLAVLLSFGGVVVLFYALIPPLIQQTQDLVKVLPTYIGGWEAAIDRLAERIPALQGVYKPGEHKILTAVYAQVSGQFGNVVPKVLSLVEVLVSLFSVIVMGLYLSIHPAQYREWLIALFPPRHRDLVRDVLADCASSLRAYIVGLLLTMTFLGTLTALGLKLLH
ncbi:MAG: AI-2E family transporter, partial [Gemmatimonadota bacterium]|nr:AI-2E family transporter [Gemmatimonadota bacterium]